MHYGARLASGRGGIWLHLVFSSDYDPLLVFVVLLEF
jgi:hypothetical protein